MLEQFKVKEADAVKVREAPLRETVASIFEKMGVSDSDSALATDVLVKADMRGVDTHGVSNMLRAYVGGYGSSELNPSPNWRVVRETPATATIDSDRGLGIIVVPKAMEIAIGLAGPNTKVIPGHGFGLSDRDGLIEVQTMLIDLWDKIREMIHRFGPRSPQKARLADERPSREWRIKGEPRQLKDEEGEVEENG